MVLAHSARFTAGSGRDEGGRTLGDLLALTNRDGRWYWMALGRDGMPVCGRTWGRDTAIRQAKLATQPADPFVFVGPDAGWEQAGPGISGPGGVRVRSV